MFAPHAFADCIMTHAGMAIRATRFACAWEDQISSQAYAYPGHPTFTPAGATATPMAPPRSIALCKKPHIRISSINALTSASAAGRAFGTTLVCGTLNRPSGTSLLPGVGADKVGRRL